MRTSNPVFNPNTFSARPVGVGYGEAMTVNGTINRAGILLLLALVAALFTWNQVANGQESGGYVMIGALGGFVVALVTTFKAQWAGVTAPIYAVLEGLFLGGVSAMVNMAYPGIAIQAVALTFGVFFCMLLLYRSGVIRATEKFKIGVFAATGAIALFYLITMVLGFFHIQFPLLYGSSPIGIGFSLVVVGIAALNLILDFDFIEQAAMRGAPKYMEWYGAFGLMVTLVWLYLEILRLLSKLRDRR
jgi:uncharacterized YccA/Bax inhibitor family protein